MNQATVITLARDAILITLEISAPVLLVALVVGLLISVFQAATQIQEATLPFIFKALAAVAILALLGPWMLSHMTGYTTDLYKNIPMIVKSSS